MMTKQNSSISNSLKIRLAWSIFIFVVLGISVASLFRWTHLKQKENTLPILGALKPFEFIERSEKPFGTQNLKGSVWVADFIFTRCGGPCPIMTLNMGKLQEMLTAEGNIKLVSFSVDPEFDSPQVLREYAGRFNAQEGRWFFLTGKPEAIYAFAQDSFKIVAQKNPDADQNPAQGILHSTHLILVDAEGRVRGYYDGSDAQVLPKVVRDAKTLLYSGRP